MKKPVTILILPPQNFPVPAVKGGAVEQLITYLLEENEKFAEVRFIVISKHDSDAAKIKFKNSLVYYLSNNTDSLQYKAFNAVWFLYRLFCAFTLNRFSQKLFKFKFETLSKYQLFCKRIAKKEKVDYVSIEGQWEMPFRHLNTGTLKGKIFTHLHSSRSENIDVRKTFNNSILLSNYLRSIWVKTDIKGKNTILRNCANTEIFDTYLSREERIRIRSTLGISADDYLLIFCGRIVPIKGVSHILDAFCRIQEQDIKLLLIGSANFGNESFDEYEQNINDICKHDSRIIRLKFVENTQLPIYYNIADTLLFPSTCQEGAPLVPIEAMASGLPIIATDSGGVTEYVTNQCALFLPINDDLTHNLYKSILELYHNPEKRKQMSLAGKERAKLFSKENYYKNFVKIFTE